MVNSGTPLKLIDQMKMAAQQFFGIMPAGSFFDYNGQLYRVDGATDLSQFLNDPTKGIVVLDPVNGGGPPVLLNPLDYLYPNHSAPVIPVAAAKAAGIGAQNIMGYASLGGSFAPLIKEAVSKGGKAAAGAAGVWTERGSAGTGSGVYQAGMYGPPNAPQGGNAPILIDPSSQLHTVQQNLNSLTGQMDKFLGVPYSSLDPTAALEIANGNFAGAYNLRIEDLQKSIAGLDQKIFEVGHPPSTDFINLNDILNPPAPTPLLPPDAFPGQSVQLQGLMTQKTSYEAELNRLLTPDGHSEFMDPLQSNYGDVIGQIADLQAQSQALQDLQAAINTRVSVYSASANKIADGIIGNINSTTDFNSLPTWTQQGLTNTTQSALKSGELVPFQYNADNKIIGGNYDPGSSVLQQTSATQKIILDQYRANLMGSLTEANVSPDLFAAARADAFNKFYSDGQTYANANAVPLQDAHVQEYIQEQLTAGIDPNTGLNTNVGHNFDSFKKKGGDAYDAALRSQQKWFGVELGLAGVAAYGEESAWQSLFQNGFSGKAFMGLLTAGGTLYGLLHSIHKMLVLPDGETLKLLNWLNNLHPLGLNLGHILGPFMKFISSGWGFLVLQLALVAIAALFGFGKNKKSSEDIAMETLNQEVNPVVWNPNGQVILLTAGLTMATMGLQLSPQAPMMQTMTLSQASAIQILTAAGAQSIPAGNDLYASVFVQPAGAGHSERVLWVTPTGFDSKGHPEVTITVDTLKPGMQFAASQPTSFIPFFIPKPGGGVVANPQVVQNLSDQAHLLLCADGVSWVSDAQLCASAAGATSHIPSSGGH